MKTPLLFTRTILMVVGCMAALSAMGAQPAPRPALDEKKYIPYRIARGDQLGIAVFGENDLTGGGKRVDNTGTIVLQLVGEIRVVGLTIVEAQAAIENAYRDGRYLRNPQVTVTVEQAAPRWVAISGKINVPGRHEMPTDTVFTLRDLIIKAGGLQETARGTKVRITRTLADGRNVIIEKDVESLMRAKSNANAADAAFPLEPEDIVYVPEKII